MGTCIICGTATDGEVCSIHEEDVAFVFEGTSPGQLTPNRFYRGSVDGYADFGVFVDVGDSVTGLLHQSEIDQRLESLSWEPGDRVFVQVDGVRDNGNVDLSWSIRQSADEFRGLLIDAPEGDRRPDDGGAGEQTADDRPNTDTDDDPAGSEVRQSDGGTTTGVATAAEPDETPNGGASVAAEPATNDEHPGSDASDATPDETDAEVDGPDGTTAAPDETDAEVDASDRTPAAPDETDAGIATTDAETGVADDAEDTTEEPASAAVGDLQDLVGDLVRIEGEVTGIEQTSGPTIFELRDGTATVECAAFESAGVRAYPEVDVGDYVRLDGEVERRRGELQVETETLLVLAGEEREEVVERIDEAIEAAVRPEAATFVAEDDPAAPLADGIVEAATAVRRAVAAGRPVVVRHPATADGYAAGAAIERGARSRARAESEGAEPDYHAVIRRPLDDAVYGMDAVTSDLTRMLQDRERHGEQLPLIVLAGLGSSVEAREAVELLDVYDVDRVVLDVARPDDGVESVGEPVVNPHLAGVEAVLSNAALGAALGATVDPDVAADLAHVPAIGYWEAVPEAYADAAAETDYDVGALRAIRESLALEAHYQSYNDKRELVEDVLFEGAPGLSEHVAEQFREKLETELATARENLVVRETDGVRFAVLDTDAFTHRFDFPPTELLLDTLHRHEREREQDERAVVSVGAGEEELYVRSTEPVDVRAVAEAASEVVPGVAAVGGRDGHVEYLPGTRDDAIEAVIGAVADAIDA